MLARVKALQALFRNFARQKGGAVALTFGIAAVPMMLAAGVALDFVHASALNAKLQGALDSATLAAAASPNLSDKERIALAKSVFARNWENKETRNLKADPKFVIEGNGVRGKAEVEAPTALLRILGINRMTIGSDVTVAIPEGQKAEVVLVLDYSGSMNEVSGGKVKYIAMRDAAKKLVDDLAASAKKRLKVGLVPFSHQVYLTLPHPYVRGQTGGGNWTGCTVDRKYPYNITDATPSSDDNSKWGQPQDPSHLSDGCSGYVPRNLKLIPLTDDFAAVTDQLDVMTPYAWTHIALGAEFGWQVLSPNPPFTGAAQYSDKKTQKVMVLLTDGRQTEPAFGPTARSVAQGEKNLSQICQAMKDDGITVVTLAFQIDDEATKTLLRNCTSDPETDFFIAEDSSDIAGAFEQIRTQIASKIYISK